MATVQAVTLDSLLSRKNPYLLRALALETATDLIERILSHQLTASDETIFGDAFFEFVARGVPGVIIAPAEGIDFAIETDNVFKVYAMKSGPNVQNSGQRARQGDEFNEIRSRLFKLHKQFDPVVGHCYGRYESSPTKKRSFRDLSGQAFWTDFTGDQDFYMKLITFMGDAPKRHRDEFEIEWSHVVNRLTGEFILTYCRVDGSINWEQFVEYVSGISPRPRVSRSRSSRQPRPDLPVTTA